MISKKIKVFTLNRSCIEYFGKHCCEITYKRSLIVLHVYFFSLFPIAPLFSYRPPIAPFLLTAPLNLANAPWGAVAPTLGTTALGYISVQFSSVQFIPISMKRSATRTITKNFKFSNSKSTCFIASFCFIRKKNTLTTLLSLAYQGAVLNFSKISK